MLCMRSAHLSGPTDFRKSSEDANTIADGALGKCGQARRDLFATFYALGMNSDEANETMHDKEEELRRHAIGNVLETRSAR